MNHHSSAWFFVKQNATRFTKHPRPMTDENEAKLRELFPSLPFDQIIWDENLTTDSGDVYVFATCNNTDAGGDRFTTSISRRAPTDAQSAPAPTHRSTFLERSRTSLPS